MIEISTDLTENSAEKNIHLLMRNATSIMFQVETIIKSFALRIFSNKKKMVDFVTLQLH